MSYDLCLRTGDQETLEVAKKLGFSGVGIILGYERGGEKTKLSSIAGLDVSVGVELKGKEISKARDMRRTVELILVNVQEPREALETPEVDIVLCPEEVNQVLARLAKKNNIAIGFEFSRLLHASKKSRSDVLHSYKQAAAFVRKYKAPFVLVSGALSKWDLRSPSDLMAFGKILGFGETEIKRALSGQIIKENRKRSSKKWVIPGVEAVTD